MRETLFKGKRKDNGEWVEGYSLPHKVFDEAFIVPTGMGVFRDEKVDGLYRVYAFEVIPETVRQNTGEDDINGEEIFEGDIIKTRFFGKQVGDVVVGDYETFIVTFKEATFYLESKTRRFPLSYVKYPDSKFVIIGNIHDNPELLEV